MSTPIDEENFIRPCSRRLHKDECEHRNVVQRHYIKNVPIVLRQFALLSILTSTSFLVSKRKSIQKPFIFYANLSISNVPEGTKPVLRCNLLGTPIEFSLFTLAKPLTFSTKVTSSIWWSMKDYQDMSEAEVYSILVNIAKPRAGTSLKPDFCVIFKWYIENVVPRTGHNDFIPFSESFSLFSCHRLENKHWLYHFLVYVRDIRS